MIHYGGDYNPEQWPEPTWHEDVRLMREAGVTMVSVGIFAWSRIQPEEGVFDWGWLDRVIDLLHENGIAVDLATATASPPAWASAAYPEMLPQDEIGATYWPGSRQHYAPTSPVYRRLASELVRALAERYAAHPAVVLWHVNNEYGCHLHYDYSDNARDAFRVWLAAKYGQVDALNRAWGTDFWSQRYGSFDQVVPPRKAPYSHNPAGLLDFRRFTSDALLGLFRMEKSILLDAGATQPITTNFMGAFPPADYWSWAAEVDVISDDNYPDPNDPESFRASAFTRDLMRSLKPGVPWILMEQATGAVNWRPSNAPKAPGQMAALSAQAVGRGADGILFFQWRQSRRGSEKFHSAMLPHAGTDTSIWREVVDLGRTLGELPQLPGGSGARVAIVFEWENWWAIRNPDHPVVIDYLASVQRWYSALHRQHVSVDIVTSSSDLGAYRAVLAPHLYLLSDTGAANLTRFVEGGGHLLVTAFSDVVDEDDAFREGGFTMTLGSLLGLHVEEFGALAVPQRSVDADQPSFVGTFAGGEHEALVSTPFGDVRGQYFAERLRVFDAEIVGAYSSGRATGGAALTSRVHGSGRAHYIGTVPDDSAMRRLTQWMLDLAGVTPELAGIPEQVEVARRGRVLTVINHGPDGVTVGVRGVDVVSGREITSVDLPSFGWAMIREAGD